MPISDLLASISGGQASTASTAPLQATLPSIHKRKAEDDLRAMNEKTVKREPVLSNTSRPVAPIKRPANMDVLAARSKPVSTGSGSSAVKSPLSSAGPQQAVKVAPSINASNKPPKKGSFAEIMARGKAATATMSQVGKIQHKRIDKIPSKKEKEEMKAQKPGSSKPSNGKLQSKDASRRPLQREGQGSDRDRNGKASSKPAEPEKRVKKSALATTGYTGTARPIPGKLTSSSTSRYGGSSDRDRAPASGSSRRYTYASDEEDEEDEEEDEYYSDGSSDMEAATFEVDEEEERAARIARKEDAQALQEENRLKREKEEKRKKLAAMAKARAR